MVDDAAYRMKKGKCKEGENDFDDIGKKSEALFKNRLATLDIFAGCGGLSEGLEKAGSQFQNYDMRTLLKFIIFPIADAICSY